MGFRLQKRIRIFKGLTLNLSKTGTSWTVGGRGASISIRGKKVTANAGIPGTGISYRQRIDGQSTPDVPDNKPKSGSGHILFLLFVIIVVGVILAHK
jgi:hypothetical protein